MESQRYGYTIEHDDDGAVITLRTRHGAVGVVAGLNRVSDDGSYHVVAEQIHHEGDLPEADLSGV